MAFNSPSLAVSAPAPSAATTDTVAHEVSASGDLLLTCGPRVWRVRGWQKQRQPEVMKVNVQVRDSLSGAFHVDSLDMYHARSRQNYVSTAAAELACEQSVIKRECGRLLLLLEQKQDETRQSETTDNSTAVTMDADDEAAALALLKSPDLAARITDDLAACGVVGEATNLLTGYLGSATSFTTGMLAPGRGVLANTGIAMGGAFGKFAPMAAGKILGNDPVPEFIYELGGGAVSEFTNGIIKDLNTPQSPEQKEKK